jgi:hypothetical protein
MLNRKRKQRPSETSNRSSRDSNWSWNRPDTDVPDPSLFIQAHEADIARGPQAWASAAALEINLIDGVVKPGEGLIRWGDGSVDTRHEPWGGEKGDVLADSNALWVDRYAGIAEYTDIICEKDTINHSILRTRPNSFSSLGLERAYRLLSCSVSYNRL